MTFLKTNPYTISDMQRAMEFWTDTLEELKSKTNIISLAVRF